MVSNIRIGIVVLNYNNVHDTVHAVQSILYSKNASQHVLIVVDNASTDDSWKQLITNTLFNTQVCDASNKDSKKLASMQMVHLLQTGNNKGYAFGNNCGIKQCLLDTTISHVWILNNDVELKEDCIEKIEIAIQKSSSNIGIWGTLLVNFFNRNSIQTIAAKYIPFLAKTKLYYPNFPLNKLTEVQVNRATEQANYFIGASLIFSKELLEKVGLFNEQFFLYAEEIDIFLRAKQSGFNKEIMASAIVYHKEGGTTLKGVSTLKKERSLFVEFHNCRSKLLFTKIHYPVYYPIVYMLVVFNLFKIFKGNFKQIILIIQALRKDQLVH
ncbi:MAG: glycosyltransferase family 2 protein [Chitinophagaceae bacterium]